MRNGIFGREGRGERKNVSTAMSGEAFKQPERTAVEREANGVALRVAVTAREGIIAVAMSFLVVR